MPGIRLGSHIPRTVLDVQRRICGGLPLQLLARVHCLLYGVVQQQPLTALLTVPTISWSYSMLGRSYHLKVMHERNAHNFPLDLA